MIANANAAEYLLYHSLFKNCFLLISTKNLLVKEQKVYCNFFLSSFCLFVNNILLFKLCHCASCGYSLTLDSRSRLGMTGMSFKIKTLDNWLLFVNLAFYI